MVWAWVVTTALVVVTFITVKRRGYKKCRMHCGTPLPQTGFLVRFFSCTPLSDRLSTPEPSRRIQAAPNINQLSDFRATLAEAGLRRAGQSAPVTLFTQVALKPPSA